MPPILLTDAQIDVRARTYAIEHQVSYSDALGQVVAFPSAPSLPQAEPPPGSVLTDAQADAAARRFAARHGTDYLTALRMVLANQQANPSPEAQGAAGLSDHQIHQAAMAHMKNNGVSYAEALSFVTEKSAASFSEVGLPDKAVRALENQPIAIFRAGIHQDMSGGYIKFSAADVQAIASAYDPTLHEAPLTLGHPESDRPAYGWVKSLNATADGQLFAHVDKLDPAFAQDVKAGRYKKRSACFYPPTVSANPKRGTWYLKHVAWLGALAPAVKGLPDVSFAMGSNDGAVSINLD